MKPIKYLAALVVLTFVLFSSCSKQIKLEKRLDGTWNIDFYNYEVRNNGVVDPATKESYSNAGDIVLVRDDKTNTGTITFRVSGFTIILTITEWSNTEDKLTIKSTNGTQNFTDIFEVLLNEKDKQEWRATQTTTNGGVTTVEETTYKLSRK